MKHKTSTLYFLAALFAGIHFPLTAQFWTKVETGTTQIIYKTHFFDANNGWIVGGNGGAEKGKIFTTNNAGGILTNHSTDYYNDIWSISATDMNTAWIADGSISVRHTVDGGKTWNVQNPGPSTTFPYNLLREVVFLDENIGWTAGDNGTIYHTTDGGLKWDKQISGVSTSIKFLFFLDSNLGWASGVNDVFLKTTDGGKNWNKMDLNLVSNLQGYGVNRPFFFDKDNGWVPTGYPGGAILYTTDGGQSFTTVFPTNGNTVNSVYFTSADTGWAVGAWGAIYKSVDAGKNWSVYKDIGDQTLMHVRFTDSNAGWACGSNGELWRYSNQASTVQPVQKHRFALYPNPSQGCITIECEGFLESDCHIDIINPLGSIMKTQLYANHQPINLRDFAPGIYYIKVRASNAILYTEKIIIE